MKTHALTRRSFVAAPAIIAASKALGQAYPSRPVTLVVTFAAGGGVDVTSRLFAEAMSDQLGQRLIVENRAGAATMTGTQSVAKAAADGYTVLAAPTTMVINPAVRENIPFNWETELVPVGLMAKLPFVVVAGPNSPLRTMKDLENLAKTRTNPVLFASGGTGTVAHLAGELFAQRIGKKMQHVPYRGEGPSLVDVASGTLDVTFSTLAGASALVQAGSLRALGITTAERAALLPEVPTIAEQGYADFDVSAWVGLMVPAGMSADVVQRLREALSRTLGSTDLQSRLGRAGSIPAPATMAFDAFLKRERDIWLKVIREANIKIDP
ncbi:MAG: Bug family tripartite tricarboxylate transporter substrate binding protein [Beijerinckiaceae bacterium]